MIEITRGDYKEYRFQRKTSDGEIIIEVPDKMYITFKRNHTEKEALFQKTLENGITFNNETFYYKFAILPEDTDELSYTQYCYDIEIIHDTDKPKTILKGTLNVTKEVTMKNNEV